MPRRVRVMGTSGAGKTRVARRLAASLGVPHIELDALHHRAGWQQAPDPEFQDEVRQAAATSSGWVADGNYESRLGAVLANADTYVWLDYPRRVVIWRLVRRTLVRVILRRELWNGNREEWRGLFSRDPRENILLWAWTTHATKRRRYEAASNAPSGAIWVRLESPKQAEKWLRAIEQGSRGS